ncbi:hypothetical protein LOCUS_51460 [Klebsiella pneumoniae]|nr:hypothetical protein KML001_49390 [Klebsiella quasipneumoniae subsp. similipneumoniae]GMA04411.1 hypothetical protein KML003_45360 [Klebsiella quasipneumoniae subsp. similipneumoniae]GMX30306.1 hypothetical protein LOCUS_51460 [Klebsiella pneumoniae]
MACPFALDVLALTQARMIECDEKNAAERSTTPDINNQTDSAINVINTPTIIKLIKKLKTFIDPYRIA